MLLGRLGVLMAPLDTHTVLLLLLLPLDLDVLLDRFVWVHYICIIAWVKSQMPRDFCISSFGELELMRTKAFSGYSSFGFKHPCSRPFMKVTLVPPLAPLVISYKVILHLYLQYGCCIDPIALTRSQPVSQTPHQYWREPLRKWAEDNRATEC